jgi:hypothetical protein
MALKKKKKKRKKNNKENVVNLWEVLAGKMMMATRKEGGFWVRIVSDRIMYVRRGDGQRAGVSCDHVTLGIALRWYSVAHYAAMYRAAVRCLLGRDSGNQHR